MLTLKNQIGLLLLLTLIPKLSASDLRTITNDIEKGKNLAQAKAWLMERVEQGDPHIWLLVAKTSNKLGDHDNGIKYGEKACAAMPDNAEAFYLQAVARRMKMAENPMSWMMGGSKYIKLLEKAIENDKQFLPAYNELVGFYLNAPAIAGGSDKKAIALADQIHDFNQKEGLLLKANIMESTKKSDEAFALYTQLAQTEPNDPDVRFAFGCWLQKKERYEEALTQLTPLTQGPEPHLAGLYQCAKTHMLAKKDLALAVLLLDRYIASAGEAADLAPAYAWWRKALALEQLGQRQQAQAAIAKAHELKPEDDTIHKDWKRLIP